MCLACELDALWYAEWERLAAEGVNVPGSADVPPAVPGEPAVPGNAGPSPALSTAPGGMEGGAASAALTAWMGEDAERAGGTPAFPDPAVPASPARPGAPRSGFRCEETE
jgi:hypothetical protein